MARHTARLDFHSRGMLTSYIGKEIRKDLPNLIVDEGESSSTSQRGKRCG